RRLAVGLGPVAINHFTMTAGQLTPRLMREVSLTSAGHAPVTLTGACNSAPANDVRRRRATLVSAGLLGLLR
ncbi:MAG: hypothetical protein QOH27_5426, partial [Mycobacterium sp.]|nr:hypothetical protein [Mycobacterium sp.]